jgi:hypothetical protein
VVELLKDGKVVDCKWVYKIKKGVDDKVERYKARLVVKGYSQKEDESIYMEQPEGFVQDRNKSFVCKFKKSLYGLRQSLRKWYKKFDSFIVSLNFTRNEYDHCVYFKKLENDIFNNLVLCVDDMLVARKNMVEINMLRA